MAEPSGKIQVLHVPRNLPGEVGILVIANGELITWNEALHSVTATHEQWDLNGYLFARDRDSKGPFTCTALSREHAYDQLNVAIGSPYTIRVGDFESMLYAGEIQQLFVDGILSSTTKQKDLRTSYDAILHEVHSEDHRLEAVRVRIDAASNGADVKVPPTAMADAQKRHRLVATYHARHRQVLAMFMPDREIVALEAMVTAKISDPDSSVA